MENLVQPEISPHIRATVQRSHQDSDSAAGGRLVCLPFADSSAAARPNHSRHLLGGKAQIGPDTPEFFSGDRARSLQIKRYTRFGSLIQVFAASDSASPILSEANDSEPYRAVALRRDPNVAGAALSHIFWKTDHAHTLGPQGLFVKRLLATPSDKEGGE